MSEPGIEPTEPTTTTTTANEPDAPGSAQQPSQVGAGGEGQDGAPTVIVLTEEALKPVDVEKIVAMHSADGATYRVLVPNDNDRNVLSSFLDHLTLFEMREALESLRPVDRTEARADAETALTTTLREFESLEVAATGEITADDPIPTLVEEVARLGALEVVVVTEPHAVEDTFHVDWASKARKSLGLPVLHMYAGDWRLG